VYWTISSILTNTMKLSNVVQWKQINTL
jgi:hypothetical protein